MTNEGDAKMEVVDVDEDDERIDDEQLEEYQEMVEQLGTFPDKVKINSLSMVAEDFAEDQYSANVIYNAIRQPLTSKQVTSDRKLPLVYVVDSILKNVKGKFIPTIEKDAKEWMPLVYQALSDEKKQKLKKVWNLWKDAGVFEEASWREMGSCFNTSSASGGGETAQSASVTATLERAGISSGKDGSLLLMPALREAMQCILDDLQSDVQDELEKVSLERLATIDADLLVKIKRTAEDSLRNGGTGNTKRNQQTNVMDEKETELSFLIETRTPESIQQSMAWGKLKIDHMKNTHDMIASLQHMVREIAISADNRYTRDEAIDMTGVLATAGATAGVLTNALQQMLDEEKKSKAAIASISGDVAGTPGAPARGFFTVDKSLFTNEGIKKKNDAVIGILYEIGLPFVSSSDGRRFATQLELSNHLDALFKKGQLEKTMARTEERGWYVSGEVWSGEAASNDKKGKSSGENDNAETDGGISSSADDANADPSTFTMPADESRDRCAICGINFKMFFDNDEGIYKYSNCREIEVRDDTDGTTKLVLVRVTSWRGLGSPPFLTPDQILQEI